MAADGRLLLVDGRWGFVKDEGELGGVSDYEHFLRLRYAQDDFLCRLQSSSSSSSKFSECRDFVVGEVQAAASRTTAEIADLAFRWCR